MVIFVLLVGTSCLTVDVLEEVVGVDAEIFDTTDDTEERSTGAEVSMILFPHMDFYNVMARIKQGGKRTFLRKHIQSWLLVRFRIEICIMQVSPVVRQAHESPGELSRCPIQTLLCHWAMFVLIAKILRKPCPFQKTPDALLFYEL